MTRNLLSLASGVLLTGLVVAGAPVKSASPRSTAERLAAEYRTAMMKKDIGYFNGMATKDFTYTSKMGVANRAQALEGVKSAFTMFKSIDSMTTKTVSAKMVGKNLDYVMEVKMAATLAPGGMPGTKPGAKPGAKPSKLTSTMRVEVLAVPVGGKWMYKSIRDIWSKDFIDGKPFNMGG